MKDPDPAEFLEPYESEHQVQHMTEDFREWNTIETYQNLEAAEDHAKDYAKANPETEIQIVKTIKFNH